MLCAAAGIFQDIRSEDSVGSILGAASLTSLMAGHPELSAFLAVLGIAWDCFDGRCDQPENYWVVSFAIKLPMSPRMEVLTLTIRKTSTCSALPSACPT